MKKYIFTLCLLPSICFASGRELGPGDKLYIQNDIYWNIEGFYVINEETKEITPLNEIEIGPEMRRAVAASTRLFASMKKLIKDHKYLKSDQTSVDSYAKALAKDFYQVLVTHKLPVVLENVVSGAGPYVQMDAGSFLSFYKSQMEFFIQDNFQRMLVIPAEKGFMEWIHAKLMDRRAKSIFWSELAELTRRSESPSSLRRRVNKIDEMFKPAKKCGPAVTELTQPS